jgi:signal transduction histidine kinase
MRRPRAPGLRTRLVLALFATAAATLGVAALALLPPLEHRLRDDAARTLVLHAEAARPGFEELTARQLKPSARRVRTLLHALVRTTGAQVLLVSETGVRADTDPDSPGDVDEAQHALHTRHSEYAVNADVASAAVPLRIDGRPYGLALRRHLGDVGRTFRVVEAAFAGAAIAGLALALICGLALSGRMLRRLRALRDAVRGAELGEPERLPPPDSHRDEIGELSRAFTELQLRLAAQEGSRRAFVATASHELRTPVASLQSLLELVADEIADEQPNLELVRADVLESLAQARRLGGLASGLLDISRLDAGTELRTEPVELAELARAVTAEFRARPTAGPERPRWIAPGGPCWALGDPDALARVVRLLVDNALRHTPASAAVEVRPERRGDVVLVRVLDGGPGVDADERAAIFERFRRGEASAAPGFGLGLAIGRELAHRMDGELALEEGPPGPGEPAGARFALALPADPAAVAVAPIEFPNGASLISAR